MKKVIDICTKVYRTILVIMTGVIVVLGVYQVVGRNIAALGLNTSWTEEAMRYIYLGIIMLGLATVTRDEAFTTITILSDAIKKRSKIGSEILYVFQNLASIVCFGLLFYYGLKLDLSAGNRVSATMLIPFSLIYAPIPIGSFLATIIQILKTIEHFITKKDVVEGGEA